MLRIHNRVNKILGKSEFPEDIEAIKKRWKVGWRDAAPQRLVDSNTYGTFYLFPVSAFSTTGTSGELSFSRTTVLN